MISNLIPKQVLSIFQIAQNGNILAVRPNAVHREFTGFNIILL